MSRGSCDLPTHPYGNFGTDPITVYKLDGAMPWGHFVVAAAGVLVGVEVLHQSTEFHLPTASLSKVENLDGPP